MPTEDETKQNENVKAYYELMECLKKHEEERKWERKQKAKLLRLYRSIAKTKEKLAKMEKEYTNILYDDKLFVTHMSRQRWIWKHEKEGNE